MYLNKVTRYTPPSEILVKLDVTGNNEIARVYVGGNGYYSETKYLSME